MLASSAGGKLSEISEMSRYFQSAVRTFRIEQEALLATIAQLDEAEFAHACEIMLAATGRIIVTGIGKSGHIASKLASTLASTGTPALFLHAAEAAHGDMGMVTGLDVVLMLSKSGASDELLTILPTVLALGVPIIAMTMGAESKLAHAARQSGGAVLRIAVKEEACPLDLAPTASTTAMLALGDALAVALLEARNFTSEDFAKLHPAGALGRRLTFAVRDFMATGDAIPIISESASLTEALLEISGKRYGATAVVDSDGALVGIITDGDVRRFFQRTESLELQSVSAADLMTQSPRTITADILAIDALHEMEDRLPKVMQLLVVGKGNTVEGIIHLHDIVKAGIS